MALSTAAATELRSIMDASLSASAAAAPATAAGAPGAVVTAAPNFCSIWPTAKPILQALAGVIIFFPGFGAAAAAALNALVAAGQAVFDQTCH